jgi:hypothetical protein
MTTPNQVPRGNNQGEVGTSLKNWLKGWFKQLFVGADGIVDVNQNAVIKTEATADAVNYIIVKNAASGSGPQAKAEGTDDNIDFIIKTKGNGKFQILDGNDNGIIEFHTIADAVNFLKTIASITENPLTIEAVGTDSNIDIVITPKGTGELKTGAGIEMTGAGKELLVKENSISFTEQVLTSGENIAWDLKNGNRARLTAGHNFLITITKPSGAVQAELIVTQDAAGSREMDEIITQFDDDIATSDVHADTDVIDVAIDIPTGARIRFKTTTTLPTPLGVDTIYYAIRISETEIQVAETKALAVAGTKIDIENQGTGTHTVQQLVKWAGGTLGVLQTAAGGEDIVRLAYKPNDEQWYAQILSNFY